MLTSTSIKQANDDLMKHHRPSLELTKAVACVYICACVYMGGEAACEWSRRMQLVAAALIKRWPIPQH